MTPRQRGTLTAAILGSSVVFLDTTIVTVALPGIGEDLATTRLGVLEAQSYIYNGYLLALASMLILAGAMSDFYGRRRGFLAGLVGFTVASVACGLAFSVESLIVFRVLQGLAGAFIVPGSLAIITVEFAEEERGRAFGIWAGSSALATILGPFVGGVLVDVTTWRAAFLLNVPLLAVALVAVVVGVRESKDPHATGKFDWRGAVIVAVAVGGLGFGSIRGQESQWQDASAFAGLIIGGLALVGVPVWMARAANPLVPPWLFRSRNFTVVNIATVLIYGALYAMFYFVPVYLQGAIGYNAAASGIALAAAMGWVMIFSPRFGKLATRYGPRWFLAGGPALMAVGLGWLARVPASTEPWVAEIARPSSLVPPGGALTDVLPPMVVFGLGTMMMVAPLTTALMGSVPVRNSGVASAVNNALSRVGPQLATALIFVVATSIFFATLGDRAPGLDTASDAVRETFSPLNAPADGTTPELVAAAAAASNEAFEAGMLLAAGLLVAAGVVSAAGIRNPAPAVEPARVPVPVTAAIPNCPPLDVDCLPGEGEGPPAAA